MVICAFFFWAVIEAPFWKSLNIVQEVYNRDRSPDVDDVEVLAVAATKHLDLLKQKEAESSFIIEKTVRELQAEH